MTESRILPRGGFALKPASGLFVVIVALLASRHAVAFPPPDTGPGGPVLVIASPANPFSRYYAEILRAEGLNYFDVHDITDLTPTLLAGYDATVLGQFPLTPDQVSILSDWVNAGGNLIAMRPDPQL